MTRATLYRALVAFMLLRAGHPGLFRYLMPRRWKLRQYSAQIANDALRILCSKFIFAMGMTLGDSIGNDHQVGDTVQVRMPARFTIQ